MYVYVYIYIHIDSERENAKRKIASMYCFYPIVYIVADTYDKFNATKHIIQILYIYIYMYIYIYVHTCSLPAVHTVQKSKTTLHIRYVHYKF